MIRNLLFPLTAAGICAVLGLTGGCASRQDIVRLNERVQALERAMRVTQTDVAAGKAEMHDLDLRVEYLEREATRRGVSIPPRHPKTAAPPQADDKQTSSASAPQYASAAKPDAEIKPPTPVVSETGHSLPLSPKVADEPKVTQPPKQTAPVTPKTTPPAHSAVPVKQESDKPAAATAESAGSLPAPADAAAAAAETAAQPKPLMPRVSESTPSTPNPPSSPTTAPAKTEQKVYDAALQLYRTGRFPEAEAAFQAFLKVYPNSRLVPNALYWKGETFYSRGHYADAIFAFKDVQTRFPKNQKTPDSLLKTAMAYQKLGDKANASLHLAVLYEDWPQAEATQRARKMGLKP